MKIKCNQCGPEGNPCIFEIPFLFVDEFYLQFYQCPLKRNPDWKLLKKDINNDKDIGN